MNDTLSRTEKGFDPYQRLSPKEYVGLLQTNNENAVNHYREIFRNLPLESDQCIVTTGSDGKEERHSQSKTEFIVIQTEDRFPAINRNIREAISHDFRRDIDPIIETKTIGGDVPLSWAFKKRKLVYPDRLLNAFFVIGNRKTYRLGRQTVLKEMSNDEPQGRRIRKHMGDQLRRYKKSLNTGISRGVETFSSEEGWQYYSEINPTGYGFKHGFLRSVQRKLDILTTRWIMGGVVSIDRLAQDLPTATYEKFDYFADLSLLPKSLAQPTKTAYSWFLQQYHMAQEDYQRSQVPVIVPFSTRVFHEHSHSLQSFLELKS